MPMEDIQSFDKPHSPSSDSGDEPQSPFARQSDGPYEIPRGVYWSVRAGESTTAQNL